MIDIFKQTYTELLPEVKEIIANSKVKAQELWDLMDATAGNREIALAKTNLEQAIMWFVKGMANFSDRAIAAEKTLSELILSDVEKNG